MRRPVVLGLFSGEAVPAGAFENAGVAASAATRVEALTDFGECLVEGSA